MKTIKQILSESKNPHHPWVEPSLKHVRDSGNSLHEDDPDYKKTHKSYKEGSVHKIPHKYFTHDEKGKKDHSFEAYTKKDLNDKNLEPRVKRIAHGLKHGGVPMILGTKNKKTGKIHIHDGFTRAGVAIGLGKPIYAKLAHV